MSISITKMKDNIHQFDDARLNDCRIIALKDHLYSELKDEGVVLSLKNGKYYGLNEVGRSIWQIIQSPATVDEIQTAIMQEYEVDEETCRKEVLAFLKQMAGEELLEIQNEKDS
jgi:hypothetical protein